MKQSKRGMRPTRKQKMAIQKYGLDPEEYLVIYETSECLHIINKKTKKTQDIRY